MLTIKTNVPTLFSFNVIDAYINVSQYKNINMDMYSKMQAGGKLKQLVFLFRRFLKLPLHVIRIYEHTDTSLVNLYWYD